MSAPIFGMVIQDDKVVSLDSVVIIPDPTSICGQAALKQAEVSTPVTPIASTEETI
jgi:hypothetical protein